MDRILLIVGASVRAAAFSAIRAGWQPRAVDRFADWDLKRVCRTTRIDPYPEGITQCCGALPPEMPWLYTGAMENRADLVGRMASSHTLLGNRPETLRLIRDPAVLRDSLRRAGFLVPECRPDGDRVPIDGSWLRKPVDSAGGGGIAVWRGPSRARDGVGRLRYLQRRIEGLPCSAVYVAAGQRSVLLGMTRQLIGTDWCGARGFRYAGSLGPLRLPPRLRSQLGRLGNTLSRQFGLTGLFGVDLILQGQRAWTVEVNPRYTASVEVLERGLGISAIALHVAACARGCLPRPLPGRTRPTPTGKAIVYADRELVMPRLLTDSPPAVRWPALADIPAPGTRVRSDGPIATVFADGSDLAEVIARLRRRADTLKRRLVPIRLTASSDDRPAAAGSHRVQQDAQSL